MRLLFCRSAAMPVGNPLVTGPPHARIFSVRVRCEYVTEQYDFCLTCNAHWIKHHHTYTCIVCTSLTETARAGYCVTFPPNFPFFVHNSNSKSTATHDTCIYTRSERSHLTHYFICCSIAGATRIYTGSIILKVSGWNEDVAKHGAKRESEMRTRTPTYLAKTRNKYLHWQRYYWRHPDASGPIVYWVLARIDKVIITSSSEHIPINTHLSWEMPIGNWLKVFASRSQCFHKVIVLF